MHTSRDSEYEQPLRLGPVTAWDTATEDNIDAGPWGYLIPRLHQVLAAPLGQRPWTVDHREPIVSYFTASYLVGYLLGWNGATLWTWVSAGRPHLNDVRLRLLASTWTVEQTSMVAAVLSDGVIGTHHIPALGIGDPDCYSGYNADLARADRSVPVDLRDTVRGLLVGSEVYPLVDGPLGCGGDPLHLSDHLAAVGKHVFDGTVVSLGAQQAVLLLDSGRGWYGGMVAALRRLPASTRLQVWVRPIGYMGSWRISRETGLCFSGRHRVHLPNFI